jgi:hypothetical protein
VKFYDVWSLHPGNLVADFETEDEAMAVIRDLLAAGWSADDLSLGWGDTENDAKGGEISTGAELAARVLSADPKQPRRSA